jgi:hypothetical protein
MISCPECDVIISNEGKYSSLADEPCEECKKRNAHNNSLPHVIDNGDGTASFGGTLVGMGF